MSIIEWLLGKAQETSFILLTAMSTNPIQNIPPNAYLSCFQQACHEVCTNEPPCKRARINSTESLRFVRPTSHSGTDSDRPKNMLLINNIRTNAPHIYLEKFIEMYAPFVKSLEQACGPLNCPNDIESIKDLIKSILACEITDQDKLGGAIEFNMYLLSMQDIQAQLEPSLQ